MSVQCPPGSFSYRIAAGDTLYALAGRYGTTVAAIISANPGINPNELQVGQVICIPTGQGTCPVGTITYIIKAGDTLYAIAQRYGTTVQAILEANPGINPNLLFIGQAICIPVTPGPTQDCAIILSLSGSAVPALPTKPGGVVLVQQTGSENYIFTFVGRGLPAPSDIQGNFNAYVGTVVIGTQTYLVNLTIAQAFEQEPTWSGTRTIPATPFGNSNNSVTIAPFNTQTGVRGNPIMGGNISQCKK